MQADQPSLLLLAEPQEPHRSSAAARHTNSRQHIELIAPVHCVQANKALPIF
jgi:hypothetical protein